MANVFIEARKKKIASNPVPSNTPIVPIDLNSFKDSSEQIKYNQEQLKEQIRNPISKKITDFGVNTSRKIFGNNKITDFIASIPGGVAKTIERPIRSLYGGAYQVGLGIRGLKDPQYAEDFNSGINPYMTPEDVSNLKDNTGVGSLKYGTRIAGDVVPWVIPGGASLKAKVGLGAVSGAAGAFGEENVTPASVLRSSIYGAGSGVVAHGASKLRSKISSGKQLRSGAVKPETPQIESPKSKLMLDSPETVKTIAPENPNTSGVSENLPENVSSKSPAMSVDDIKSSPETINFKQHMGNRALTGFKTLLSKYGETGKKVSGLLDSFESRTSVKTATSLNKFKKSLKGLKNQKGSKPTVGTVSKTDNESVINYILDVYNGKKPKPITNEQLKVAESFFKDVTYEPSLLAGKYGLKAGGQKLGKPKPFIPLIPKDINKFKSAHIDRLMKSGMGKEEAVKSVNDILEEMFNPSSKINGRKFPGFENRRFFEPQSYSDLVDYGYASDIFDIAQKWSEKAWRRVEGISHFGGKDYAGINQVLDSLRESGVPVKDIEYLKKSMLTFLGGRERGSDLDEKIVSSLKDISSTKLTPSSGLKQPLSLAQNVAIVGPWRTIKNAVKMAAKKIRPEDKNVVDNAGLILEDRFDEVLLNNSEGVTGASNIKEFGKQLVDKNIPLGDKVASTLRGISKLNFKLTGIKPMDTAIRKLSGYSGLEWMRSSLRKIAKEGASGNEGLLEELRTFAFTNENELANILKNGGNMTDEQASIALNNFVKKTQFGVSRAELPASWSNTALGEVVTSLRSYGFEQAQFVGRMWNVGKKTKNWRPLATYLATYLGIGYSVDQLTSFLMKTEDDEETNALYKIGDLTGQAMFAMYWDAIKYSGFASGAVGMLGGPVASEAYDVATTGVKTAKNLVDGKQDPLKEIRTLLAKRVVGKVPYAGPRIVEAVKGPRRSSSGSRTSTIR